MTNRPPVFQRLNLTWLLCAALFLLVVDPLGMLTGVFAGESYSQIRSELSKTVDAKVQLVASWDDYYSLEYNNYWRVEMGTEFVERNYGEVLSAASLGDEYFNEYLNAVGTTHLLLPRSTDKNGRIFHKFGSRGTIDIALDSPFLTKVADSYGAFASSLYLVTRNVSKATNRLRPDYQLKWNGVGPEFYSETNRFVESGMYSYEYNTFYKDGPDVSWFYDLTPEFSGSLEIEFQALGTFLDGVNVEIELVAAYGPNAPDHVVVIESNGSVNAVKLQAGANQVARLTIRSGERVMLSNGTPCRIPSTFETADLSLNKICFGVSAIRVTRGD